MKAVLIPMMQNEVNRRVVGEILSRLCPEASSQVPYLFSTQGDLICGSVQHANPCRYSRIAALPDATRYRSYDDTPTELLGRQDQVVIRVDDLRSMCAAFMSRAWNHSSGIHN